MFERIKKFFMGCAHSDWEHLSYWNRDVWTCLDCRRSYTYPKSPSDRV